MTFFPGWRYLPEQIAESHDRLAACGGLVAWAEKMGVPPNRLYSRARRGWSDVDVLTKPPMKGSSNVREL